MICGECQRKPVPYGVKEVRCSYCGSTIMINDGNVAICQACSNKYNACRRCGECYPK